MPTGLSTLDVMLAQDERHYCAAHYYHVVPPCSSNGEGFLSRRSTMIEWMFTMATHYNYPAEVVEISLSILDRYVLTPTGASVLVCTEELQLACVVAFYMSIKTHQIHVLSIDLLVRIGKDIFTTQDVEFTERKILQAIGWRVNPPTSFAFVHELIHLVPDHLASPEQKKMLLAMANYQAEQAVGDNRHVHLTKSLVAFAAVMNAMDVLLIPSDTFLDHLYEAKKLSCVQLLGAKWSFSLDDVRDPLKLLLYNCPAFAAAKSFIVATQQDRSTILEHPRSPVTVIMDYGRAYVYC
jgi:Cyclin, N-terminal domain